MLQRWFARIPPALVLSGIFIRELLFGVGGVILAAPLTVAIFTAVKLLYVGDTLHERVEIVQDLPGTLHH